MLNSSDQEFPKVLATRSSRAIRSSSAVCDLISVFLEKERTKVDLHVRVSYWEDLLGLAQSIATTEKQSNRLSKLDEKPLDLDALELIPGSDSANNAESHDPLENKKSNEENTTHKKIKKEEKKKRKSLKKEKKESKKRKSES